MTAEEYRNERIYQRSMSVARHMLEGEIIQLSDYLAYDTKMRQKYRPVFGTLFTEISSKRVACL